MTNKITHAPEAVIAELSVYPDGWLPSSLLEFIQNGESRSGYKLRETEWWVNHSKFNEANQKQLAIIEHVYGDKKLQPEREPRWYVKTTDLDGDTVFVRKGDYFPTAINYGAVPEYENGMTEKQAKGYAELFGGEAKEIK